MIKQLAGTIGILFVAVSVQAASINWDSVTDYATASDVSKQGVLIEAINGCGTGLQVSPAVNGVLFINTPSLLGNDTDTSFFFGDTGDADYDLLLNSKDAGSESSISVGAGQLEAGKDYLVQLWYLDERGSYDHRAVIFGDGLGHVTTQLNDQYVIGTFTADGNSQTITIEGVGTGAQLTAYQVRDLSSALPVISSSAGATVAGNFTIDILFSESVTGLTADDLSVVNGTASAVSGLGSSWSATITPTSSGDVSIALPADTVSDSDGHGNIASAIWQTTYVAPGSEQPVPTLSTTTNKVFGNYTVQVDFSEPVTGLTASDFYVINATVVSVTGSGASYSVEVSPNFGGDVILSLPANSVMDMNDGLQNIASDALVTTYHINVTVDSPEALLPYLEQDNVSATLSPGTYLIDADDVRDTFGTPRFAFRGSNSTYDFTDVTINFAADIYTSDLSMNHLQVFGNHNVLKNLTMVDLCDVHGSVSLDGGVNVIMDGAHNRVEGFHMTIKGSYPYGYGDSFGKGGSYTIKHSKHSAFLVRGDYNHAKNCTLIHRSYGHALFMQAAKSPVIEGCYIEGEMRSTDDMLAETSGPAYDIDFLTDWGYRLPPGYMKCTGEGGIRSYNAGTTIVDGVTTQRGTSNPTVIDNTIVNMRTGVALTLSSGTKYVSGCTAIGCEQGFATGTGGIIENCRADVKYGPAFGVAYESDRGIVADITILPYEGKHYNGGRHFANIWGSGHNLTFRGLEEFPDQELELNLGGDKRSASALDEDENYAANNIVINNLTGYPLVLDDNTSGNTGQSIGSLTNNGTSNSIILRDWSITSNITFYGKATQSSTDDDALASLAIDQNTNGQFSEGSVTLTASEAQPWWQLELESSSRISEIKIWGRTDSYQSRLSNYDVTILNDDAQPVWTSYQAPYPNPSASVLPNVTGRYVVIQLRGTNPLSLAEVEIFGAVVTGPNGVTASTNSTQIMLEWSSVSNATSYTVQRATISGGPYSPIGTTSDLTFTDSTAFEGIAYYYVVTATIDGGESSPSDEVTATYGSVPSKFIIGSDAVTASSYQDGTEHYPSNTVDGSLDTRWSASGDGEWIRYDLGTEVNVYSLKIAWLNGSTRASSFHIETSDDDSTWTAITETLQSSGTTLELETVDVTPTRARYVRLVGHGNSDNSWNSILEVEIWGTTPAPDLPISPEERVIPVPTSSDGTMQFSIQSVPGHTYQLQRKNALLEEEWEDVGEPITGTGSPVILEDSETFSVTNGFYRLQIQA
ncbi:discoidin domain-containing protein [Pontiellaceae bacterium B1224]|nr:discoidin domain-containing protein [Pontiellaceae bacterium B1224]